MRLEIEVNGRTREVSVERSPHGPRRYRVSVDGRTQDVDCEEISDGRYSLVQVAPDAWSHDLVVAPGEAPGTLSVRVEHATFQAVVDGGRDRHRLGKGRVAKDVEQRVIAPMPGRVVRLLVAPGDEVTEGQGVVVVEAMKMENELRAPRSGRIREVLAEEGASVEAGRTLVVVE